MRLEFSNALDDSAYGVPAPSYYAIEAVSAATAPSISAALLVPGLTNVVELVLASDLVRGATYNVLAEGVPCIDLTSTSNGTSHRVFFGRKTIDRDSVEPRVRDLERLLYGVDLIWNGTDFEETATGDLARVSGTPNVTKAIWRGLESGPLPWDPRWGANIRQFVDSPSPAAGFLRTAVLTQVRRDPRVASVKTDLEIKDTETSLHITPTLRTGETLDRASVTVPNDS